MRMIAMLYTAAIIFCGSILVIACIFFCKEAKRSDEGFPIFWLILILLLFGAIFVFLNAGSESGLYLFGVW